ncbi:hypothetical protein CZ771_04350 [Actinomycetales bacterium JB111]|nr:hypothetical protein CZ771_04350 [Actinomycetales bacterium JB111]
MELGGAHRSSGRGQQGVRPGARAGGRTGGSLSRFGNGAGIVPDRAPRAIMRGYDTRPGQMCARGAVRAR